MAIDSAKKRKQAVRAAMPGINAFTPSPDGTIDALDRAFMFYEYFESQAPVMVGSLIRHLIDEEEYNYGW